MRAIPTTLPDILQLEPRIHGDARGFFLESYNARTFPEITGCNRAFVQDNHSRSAKGVLRGLHYQLKKPQDKLIRVVSGEILDVVVDLRRSSKTFLRWEAFSLSAENQRQLWVPAGFGHGFLVLSDHADVIYKVTDYYTPDDQHCLLWNDPVLAIDWGVTAPVLSRQDALGLNLAQATLFA